VTARDPKTFREFLASKRQVYGWEMLGVYLLLATCVGLELGKNLAS
jgi:hypothetical protein